MKLNSPELNCSIFFPLYCFIVSKKTDHILRKFVGRERGFCWSNINPLSFIHWNSARWFSSFSLLWFLLLPWIWLQKPSQSIVTLVLHVDLQELLCCCNLNRQYCWRFFEDFHCQEYIQFFDIHNCLFMRLHFSIGGYDHRRTARFRQNIHFSITQVLFLLIMCIDTPESTTNSRSSGLRVDAGKHLFSEGEKNVAPSCSLNFNTLLASIHAASWAPCSCHSVSSWDRSSNFGALGLRSWSSPGHMYPSEGFWSRILVWRAIAFVNFTRWIGFRMSVPFQRIDFDGVMSWNTQPNCRASDDRRSDDFCPNFLSLPRFPRSIVTLVSNWSSFLPVTFLQYRQHFCRYVFLDLLFGCSSTWRCAYEHFSPNRQPLLVL